MDKNFIIKLCNNSNIQLSDVSILLTNYCIENGKDEYNTMLFITAIINTPLLNYCVSIALDYYKKKFNIIEIKQNNKTLLVY